MTEIIKLNELQTALKSAIVGVQVQKYANTNAFAMFLVPEIPAADEVKVLLIGGNSMKYDVPEGEGAAEKARIEKELGWNV